MCKSVMEPANESNNSWRILVKWEGIGMFKDLSSRIRNITSNRKAVAMSITLCGPPSTPTSFFIFFMTNLSISHTLPQNHSNELEFMLERRVNLCVKSMHEKKGQLLLYRSNTNCKESAFQYSLGCS